MLSSCYFFPLGDAEKAAVGCSAYVMKRVSVDQNSKRRRRSAVSTGSVYLLLINTIQTAISTNTMQAALAQTMLATMDILPVSFVGDSDLLVLAANRLIVVQFYYSNKVKMQGDQVGLMRKWLTEVAARGISDTSVVSLNSLKYSVARIGFTLGESQIIRESTVTEQFIYKIPTDGVASTSAADAVIINFGISISAM